MMEKRNATQSAILWCAIVVAGYGALSFALYLLDGAITQPHPIYAIGTWLTHAARNGFQFAWRFSLGIAALVLIDLLVQGVRRTAPRPDMRFYPTSGGLRKAISATPCRVVLLSGALLLVGYYAYVEIEIWTASLRPHGLIWPPHRLLVMSLFSWGVLWITDCLRRPGGGTIVGAILFTAWTALYNVPFCVVE